MRTARAVVGILALLACTERFEFDVPSAAGGAGASTGGIPNVTLGGGGAGQSGGACASSPPCPEGLHCVNERCVECGVDAHCTSVDAPHCDPTRQRCVVCLTSADCNDGFSCDARANRCLRNCGDGEACPATAHGCDEQRGLCYQCDADFECRSSALGPRCAVDGSGCAACRIDSDCGTLLCDTLTGRCVECRDGQDCASARCDPKARVCL